MLRISRTGLGRSASLFTVRASDETIGLPDMVKTCLSWQSCCPGASSQAECGYWCSNGTCQKRYIAKTSSFGGLGEMISAVGGSKLGLGVAAAAVTYFFGDRIANTIRRF